MLRTHLNPQNLELLLLVSTIIANTTTTSSTTTCVVVLYSRRREGKAHHLLRPHGFVQKEGRRGQKLFQSYY